MRRPFLPFSLLLGVAVLSGARCTSPFEPAPSATVTLDPAALYQTIDGIGGSAADESALRAMAEPARTQVMDLVFGDLAPSVVRIKPRPALEPVNDDGDPAHVNAAGFVRPDDHLWQLDQISARGNPKLLGALWTPPAWMKDSGEENGGGSLLPGMEVELAEFFSVYLSYLEGAGHPLDWLSIQNEPESAAPWDSAVYDPDSYAATAEVIAQRLAADGHATRLVAPDTALTAFAGLYLTALGPMPTAMARFEAVAFHLYQYGYYEVDQVAGQLAKLAKKAPPGAPIWMTEFSNTTGIGYGSWDEALNQAQLIHECFVNGASMYVMWNLYRPGGPGEALIVIPTSPGGSAYTVTPKYWTLRQFTRYVRRGARRIGATSDDAKLLASAYQDEGNTVAVLINTDSEPRWALVFGGQLQQPPLLVRSSATEGGVELPPDSTERFGPRSFRLPPRSVTTAVWPTAAP
jgi:glucosylceramidase